MLKLNQDVADLIIQAVQDTEFERLPTTLYMVSQEEEEEGGGSMLDFCFKTRKAAELYIHQVPGIYDSTWYIHEYHIGNTWPISTEKIISLHNTSLSYKDAFVENILALEPPKQGTCYLFSTQTCFKKKEDLEYINLKLSKAMNKSIQDMLSDFCSQFNNANAKK